jgi:hypothetical protein
MLQAPRRLAHLFLLLFLQSFNHISEAMHLTAVDIMNRKRSLQTHHPSSTLLIFMTK